jgi:hypothetical protein
MTSPHILLSLCAFQVYTLSIFLLQITPLHLSLYLIRFFRLWSNLVAGLSLEQAEALAEKLGFPPQAAAQAAQEMVKLYKFFLHVCLRSNSDS